MAQTPASQAVNVEENDALIAAIQGQIDVAPEPGSFRVKDVIDRGDEATSAPPIVASTLTSPGYVIIYDRRTGEPSVTNRNLLPVQLRKLNGDGQVMFTTVRPVALPTRRCLRCRLHADDPERGEFDQMGLPVCRKANLASPLEVERHMKTRHPTAWDVIERARLEKEREENREYQKAILAAAARGQLIPAAVVEKKK